MKKIILLLIINYSLLIINSAYAQNLWGMTNKGGTNDLGVIFEYRVSTDTYYDRFDFSGTADGIKPYGGLLRAADGNLYGMTYRGGTLSNGVFFKITQGGTYTKLFDITGNSGAYPGKNPQGSLLQAADGYIYGMTSAGGANGLSVLFKYEPISGIYNVLVDFSLDKGNTPIGNLIQANDGNIYGLATQGGMFGVGAVMNISGGVLFQYNPITNTYVNIYNFPFNGTSSWMPGMGGGLIQTSDGKLWGETEHWNQKGGIFSFDLNSGTYADHHGFWQTGDGYDPQGTLMPANDGMLYGNTRKGGTSDSGVIFQFNPINNTLVNKKIFNGSNGSSPAGGLLQASDGYVYGTTSGGGSNSKGIIYQFDINTGNLIPQIEFTGINGSYKGADPEYNTLIDICQPTITGPNAIANNSIANKVYTTQPGMTGYNWAVSAGGNISAGQGTNNITVSWSNTPGDYKISVTYSNPVTGCTAQTTSFNVTVWAPPVAGTASVSSNFVCKDSTITLTLSGYSGEIQWQASTDNITFNTISGSATNPTPYLTRVRQFGPPAINYYYRAIVLSGPFANAISNTVQVTVISYPIAGSNSPVRVGTPLTLKASTIPGVNFNWTGPNGFTSISQNPTVSNNATTGMAGLYTVSANGCREGKVMVSIDDSPIPSAPAPVTATPSTICLGDSVKLNAVSPGDSIYWYNSPTGGTKIGSSYSGEDFIVTPNSEGNYTYYAEAVSMYTFNLDYTGSITTWTVPNNAEYFKITTKGAQGGSGSELPGWTGNFKTGNGGSGAIMKGTFGSAQGVNPGAVLSILVGEHPTGPSPQFPCPGGGGGTFVALGSSYNTSTPLIVAGGGGAGSFNNTGSDASTATSGTGPLPGKNGNGAPFAYCGGGGGGFYTSGSPDGYRFPGGNGFQQGGDIVKDPAFPFGYQSGGFGGGAPADNDINCNEKAGAGGGYSGGSGANNYTNLYSGNGGGSYNGGVNQKNTIGNMGNGSVQITFSPSQVSPTRTPVTFIVNPPCTGCKNPANITQQPVEPSAKCSPASASFSVTASGEGTISYQWQSSINGTAWNNLADGGSNPTYSGTGSPALNITNAKSTLKYLCIVSNCDGNYTVQSNIVTFTVNSSPLITYSSPDKSKCLRDTALFRVLASGDNLMYKWYKDGIEISGETINDYMIPTILKIDEGNYTCVVSNTCGTSTTAGSTLTVGSSLVINNVIPNTSECEDKNITFSADATGGELLYQWKRLSTGNIAGATNSDYTITNIKKSDEDVYSCLISNNCGSKSLPNFTFSVNQKPVVNISPVTQIKNPGENLTFYLSPEGTEPFSYQWYRDNVQLSINNEELTINNITSEDAGVYSCIVTNQCGSTTVKVGTLIITSDIKYTISGKLKYDNKAETSISNSIIYLKTPEGVKLDTVTTGSEGEFEFTDVINGVYKFECITNLAWGGSNPVDALYTNRTYLGTYTFADPLKEMAADVNNNKTINPVDALMINKRYIGTISKFTIPDWLFEDISVIVNGSNLSQDIKAICAGDVDGSYPKKYKKN